MAAFILSVISNNCRPGQSACLTGNLMNGCVSQLADPDPSLRKWVLLCIAKLWESFEDAKATAIREGSHERVCALLADPIPEVRRLYNLSDNLLGTCSGSVCIRNFLWRL
jgi:regulator-associated protein of mTOR